jgi:hypothetical protein
MIDSCLIFLFDRVRMDDRIGDLVRLAILPNLDVTGKLDWSGIVTWHEPATLFSTDVTISSLVMIVESMTTNARGIVLVPPGSILVHGSMRVTFW